MYKAEMINLVDNRMPFLSTNKMCSEDILFSLFPVRAHLGRACLFAKDIL